MRDKMNKSEKNENTDFSNQNPSVTSTLVENVYYIVYLQR